MVECGLPKAETRVRFPSPAPSCQLYSQARKFPGRIERVNGRYDLVRLFTGAHPGVKFWQRLVLRMNEQDPYDLQRFLTAQAEVYECALGELRRGRKESHWIWYIFPQVAGLGRSSMAQRYAIQSRDEAIDYLNHPILGRRLRECCKALLTHSGKRVEDIVGNPDDLKLRSSMTLFAAVSDSDSIFNRVLDAFYAGQMDERTITFLSAETD
jgi:uncharacterized protein (DUF1810 family)